MLFYLRRLRSDSVRRQLASDVTPCQTVYRSRAVAARLLQRCFRWFAGVDPTLATFGESVVHAARRTVVDIITCFAGVTLASGRGANSIQAVRVADGAPCTKCS